MDKNSVSVYQLKQSICSKNPLSFDKLDIKECVGDGFYLCNDKNEGYIEPYLSFKNPQKSLNTQNDSQTLFISATGATGKTALAKHLSFLLNAPVVDLSKLGAVGSNSLTGLLTRVLTPNGFANFTQKMNAGKTMLIIDALDEALMKTSYKGYEEFLSDIAYYCKKGVLSFILLGRNQAVEYAEYYLTIEKGISSCVLQIEAFDKQQAKSFVDCQMGKNAIRYNKPYEKLRDYIINSIDGFFENRSDIGKKQSELFLGYAPVLMAISAAIKKNSNYQSYLEFLENDNKKNIDLIIGIVSDILKRDKEEKINTQLLPDLLKNRPSEFSNKIYASAYNEEEQCLRLVLHISGVKQYPFTVSGDVTFDRVYEEQINSWLEEHPFLSPGRKQFQNTVFEAYVLVKLLLNPQLCDYAYSYLKTVYKGSFLLFFIFDSLKNRDEKIKPEILEYIYQSLKSCEKNIGDVAIEIQEDEATAEKVSCKVVLGNEEEHIHSNFTLVCNKTEQISLGSYVGNLYFDSPNLGFNVTSTKNELTSPIKIFANKVTFDGDCVLLSNSGADDGVYIETPNFVVDYKNEMQPTVTNNLQEQQSFDIYTDSAPLFPYCNYYKGTVNIETEDKGLLEKYIKLRKIIISFRSHSKGVRAKFKDAIESSRRIGAADGRKVLDKLKEDGVIYENNYMYFINEEKLASVLGISYDGLRSCTITEKIKDFIRSI